MRKIVLTRLIANKRKRIFVIFIDELGLKSNCIQKMTYFRPDTWNLNVINSAFAFKDAKNVKNW